MDNVIRTEEYKKKKNVGKVLIIVIIVAILLFLVAFITMNVKKSIDEKEAKKALTINEELQDLNRFAILDNYIVGINNDNSIVRIYNLLQGTGQFGNFTNYFYHDNKLYLLFSNNTIYTISLKEGNGVYELTKYYEIVKPDVCTVEEDITSDIVFANNGIIFNNSNCAISLIRSNNKNNTLNMSNIRIYNKYKINLLYSESLKTLYIYTENRIESINFKTKEEKVIKENVVTDKFELKNNILLYSNIVDGKKTYYGYNVKTDKEVTIVDNAEELVMYNNRFIYRTNDAIYMIDKNKSKEIYKVHYNSLSNLQLINDDVLQVVDYDTNDATKERIINIDLKNKYKTSIKEDAYYNIVEYK